MTLYHATTKGRAEQIFTNRCIENYIERFYTKELNGDECTTQGFIYFSNELFMPMYFANNHALKDLSTSIVVFKIDINEESLEADYDEIRVQQKHEDMINSELSDLQYSLDQTKSCRYSKQISLDTYDVQYIDVSINRESEKFQLIYNGNCYTFENLIRQVFAPFKKTIEGYTSDQKNFIANINWIQV